MSSHLVLILLPILHWSTCAFTRQQVSKLEFVVHAFYLNGTFAGAQQVTTQFELCPPLPPKTGLAWTFFGTNYEYVAADALYVHSSWRSRLVSVLISLPIYVHLVRYACTITVNSGAFFNVNVPSNEPLFYDPYLVDYSPDGTTSLYPVPVRVSGVSGYAVSSLSDVLTVALFASGV